MNNLKDMKDKLNLLFNTRKYKRKTDDIDKEIESLINKIENFKEIVHPEPIIKEVITDVVIDVMDNLDEQLKEIKEIVHPKNKKGRKKKFVDFNKEI